MYSRGLLFGPRARRAFFPTLSPARERVMQIKRASGSRLYLLSADTALGEKCVKLPFALPHWCGGPSNFLHDIFTIVKNNFCATWNYPAWRARGYIIMRERRERPHSPCCTIFICTRNDNACKGRKRRKKSVREKAPTHSTGVKKLRVPYAVS